jgi:ferrous iron transport protein B
MICMYLFSLVVALAAAWVLGRTVVKGKSVPLILELPPYRLPRLRTTLKMMWERASVFLKEAGSTILVATIVLWALLSFPKVDDSALATDNQNPPTAIEQSYAGQLGKTFEPAIEPLGFDWKIGVGIIGAFAAREVFVSTMGLVYGIGDVDDDNAPLREKIRAETREDGKPAYSPLTGLSLMVFFALACQCVSTLAVVRRETKSWRWPIFLFGYMTLLAYVASLVVYQGGKLLGF